MTDVNARSFVVRRSDARYWVAQNLAAQNSALVRKGAQTQDARMMGAGRPLAVRTRDAPQAQGVRREPDVLRQPDARLFAAERLAQCRYRTSPRWKRT